MASIFTYDPNPPRVSSPWSTPGRATPQPAGNESAQGEQLQQTLLDVSCSPMRLSETGITRLEAEPQEGPTEYKLHLLLRPRRTFSYTSTSSQVTQSQHSKVYLPKAGSRSISLPPSQPIQAPSMQSRQTRLQQLTTQLLWRLQQSSPFHSCSTASLILPNLPEATPKLGVASRPGTLLPGLEESQGALYEIGVSDDGTFVGLTQDELDESLTNLKAMAASLGCVVQVIRKVIVGHCEWNDSERPGNDTAQVHNGDLWVAEALVRPDFDKSTEALPPPSSLKPSSPIPVKHSNGLDLPQPEISRSKVEQLRISITGATTSGKSSLLGTLTTSVLDNGRGKSRLNLLKHRHEIASGVTSSVSQELIGYRDRSNSNVSEQFNQTPPEVMNYAAENVSSWNDIHASATRLIFLSDSPGMQRYAKSTIRTLISWKPHWTVLCVAADSDVGDGAVKYGAFTSSNSTTTDVLNQTISGTSSDLSFEHVELCLKLDLPIIVAITKMDNATKVNLRQVLSKLLSILKAAGKKPVLMSTSDSQGQSWSDQSTNLQCVGLEDLAEVERVTNMVGDLGAAVVPIVLTSALTGQGIGKLHGLFRSLPILEDVRGNTFATLSSRYSQDSNDILSKVFQVDEIFSMPPSKVYSASRSIDDASHGTVLCGYVSCGAISIGDMLTLGPFLCESNEDSPGGSSLRYSTSFPNSTTQPQPSSHGYSKSIPSPQRSPASKPRSSMLSARWQWVRVISIRNLRLPTRSLLAGQVGTIGVEPIRDTASPSCDLRRARKGMILAYCEHSKPATYRSFTASFPASDFKTQNSPPLILGGRATVYINSIKAPVKVTSVALTEQDDGTESPGKGHGGLFTFEGDGQGVDAGQDIKIKFKFLSSLEWIKVDDMVLVIPNAAAVGPITGGSVAALGGLNGFVGRICDLST